MENKTYTKADIFEVIDREIKKELERKNRYIELNGYSHKDVLDQFAARVSALSSLYCAFK